MIAAPRERVVVATILLVGWTIAAALYVTAAPAIESTEVESDIYEMQQSKKYLRDIERIGGKAAVFTAELDAWMAKLWEGKARAYTTAVLTVAVAGAYVLLRRAARPASDDEARRGG